MIYNIYCDGSCPINKGLTPGACAIVVMSEDNTILYHADRVVDDYTTNNRMELTAFLNALKYTEQHPNDTFHIYCDSQYTIQSFKEWICGWKARDWFKSNGLPVENRDLMEQLYKYTNALEYSNFKIHKVKGHSGEIGNELADRIAAGAAKDILKLIKDNRISVMGIE